MIMKGQKINDRYQIIKSIGEGGMANVYLAYDTILDRDVAVKVLRGDLSNDEKFVRRFQREALNASSLSHPNIVEVYDVGDDNGQYFIVMEYIEGKNLKDLVKKRGKLTVSEVVDIMSQIADGLSVAHDSYIIHRDIKPQNIMILENGLVKITDFGIAMAMNATQLTQTNSVMGSVHYLPPEQASGKGSTLKSDIYSMGILMYELLTGTLPYRGDNAVEIALKHLKEPLPSVKDILPDIPQSVENVILKSASKNPKNRYNDAREMYEDLKTCLDDSRVNEDKHEYQYPELDSDGKKFTKQIEKAVKETDGEKEAEEDDVIVKQITKDEVKKENRILIVLAGIFTALIITVCIFLFFLFNSLDEKDIIVPDVSGMTRSDAVTALQDAGFVVSDTQLEESNGEVVAGNVSSTNPPANAKRAKGKEVILIISTGDNAYEIEDYKGMKLDYVKGVLETHGILVFTEKQDVEQEDGKEIDADVIIGQDIEPGQKLTSRDKITLYVPNVSTKYPDFVGEGYSYEDIEEFCKKYGVTVKKKTTWNSSYSVGTVIAQSREAGYTIVSGTVITITVNEKPEDEPEEIEEPCDPETSLNGC